MLNSNSELWLTLRMLQVRYCVIVLLRARDILALAGTRGFQVCDCGCYCEVVETPLDKFGQFQITWINLLMILRMIVRLKMPSDEGGECGCRAALVTPGSCGRWDGTGKGGWIMVIYRNCG